MIEFICCGDRKIVHNLYDCNLIGDYEMIHSILNKCQAYGDMMANHIYKEGKTKTDENTWYCKYADLVGRSGCGIESEKVGGKYDANVNYCQHKFGDYFTSYISPCYHYYMNTISQNVLCKYDKGKHLTNKPADLVYGTKEELENWKYFTFNNKLPLFINICLIISQNNNSKNYIPWLVDKQYTDNEIYTLLNISTEEQKLIDKTIEKFERNSSWFKRYICGTNIK